MNDGAPVSWGEYKKTPLEMGGSYGDTWLLNDAAPRRKQNTEGPVYSDF